VKPNSLVEVRQSRIHSKGLFARCAIRRGTRVIEYVGEKVPKAVGSRIADRDLERAKGSKSRGKVYLFELDSEYDLDGSVPWNLARYANHSCDPNCEALVTGGRVWITALRPIEAGEEITFDYGYPFEAYREHPCRCGAPRCVGWIVARKEHKKLKRAIEDEDGW
jgi:SET domain-containing protein